MSPMPKRGDPDAPRYWMYETGGELQPAVRHYLRAPDEITVAEVALLRAYVVQWIDSPAWDRNPSASADSIAALDALRKQAKRIDSVRALRRWFRDAMEEGIDPL